MNKEEILQVCRQWLQGFDAFSKHVGNIEGDDDIESLKRIIKSGSREAISVWIENYVLAQNGIIRVCINDEWWYSGDLFVYPENENGEWKVAFDTFKCLEAQYTAIGKGWAFRVEDKDACGEQISACEELIKTLKDK